MSIARQRVAWISGAAVYLLLAAEWLFLVTKPSMFTLVGWPQKGAILLAAALLFSAPVVGAAVVVASAWHRLAGRWRRHAAAVAVALPAVVLSCCALLLIENFTKTVFGFNVGDFTSPVRYLYALGWLALTVFIHRSLARRAGAPTRPRRRIVALGTAALLVASGIAAWARFEPHRVAESVAVSAGRELPNILILSTDGLLADRMSVYGYERPTTPFLDSLVDELVVSENHFSNAAFTSPSIGALLSGKLPLETGVLRAGHAFRGEDTFQHLPGLLRQLGYYNIDISARFYGDAYDMNVRQGFHVANGRSLSTETLPVLGWIGSAYPSEFYFVSLTLERLRHRFLHVLGLADMRNFFDVVAKKFTHWARDVNRIALLVSELERAPRPFFAHLHLLDTHRLPRFKGEQAPPERQFNVRLRRFSRGAEPGWQDFYDDTIAGYDDYVREIFGLLQASGELDRTLLILNSDHGVKRRAHERLPLLMRFPGAEHTGRMPANTQRIDIAPTILGYLGIEPPEWMAGRSLIGGEPDPLRPVLVSGPARRGGVRWLAVVHCQRSFEFRVPTASLEQHAVVGHTAPCPEAQLMGPAEARSLLLETLERGGLSVPFQAQLWGLQRDNDPALRQRVRRAIRERRVPALWLGETIALARVYPDSWTDGTEPAAILLRNNRDRPRAFELVVGSGEEREFPFAFSVQDDEARRQYVFSAPGFQTVDLGEVGPRAERLVVVWSDGSWTPERLGRSRGVRLLLTGSWLQGLLLDGPVREWQRAAQLIVERRVPVVSLADGWLAANLHGDRWTRGTEPAGLAIRNDRSEPMAGRLVIRSGRGHAFPLRVQVVDSGGSRQVLFERPGRLVVDLPEVPPRSVELLIIRSEGEWLPTSRATRKLGVQLSTG